MNNELFESLLFEEEGTTIDFKREQYRFAKASEAEKSELVKDILGFANAWRRTTAYILVGVEEVRGGKSRVIGIPPSDHLDDHSLQQFMNSLLNTPVHFHYRAFCHEGKQVGIFVVDDGQERPIYLTRNYGKLEKDKVYVRRGSSTDPSRPASPSEVARMGSSRQRDRPSLLVEFAEVSRDDAIGTRVELECEFCSVPEAKDIPQRRDPHGDPFGLRPEYLRFHNANFYHELASYEFMKRLYRKVRITVRNIGEIAANNVRLEVVVPADIGLLPTLAIPEKPEEEETLGARLLGTRSVHRRDPGEVDIDQNNDRHRIEIDCKDLQPGRQVWSDTFYFGAGCSGDYSLQCHLFADNLPLPLKFTLTVTALVKHTTLTVEELCAN